MHQVAVVLGSSQWPSPWKLEGFQLHRQQRSSLHDLANHDGLTNLFNRRSFAQGKDRAVGFVPALQQTLTQ